MSIPHRCLLFLAFTGAVPPAAAQSGVIRAGTIGPGTPRAAPWPADARQGWWVGGGLGSGAGSMHCGICEHEREQGTTGYLRLGTTLNRKMLVGVEAGAWRRSGENGGRRLLTLTGGAWWYPNPRHGYYLRWGAGSAAGGLPRTTRRWCPRHWRWWSGPVTKCASIQCSPLSPT